MSLWAGAGLMEKRSLKPLAVLERIDPPRRGFASWFSPDGKLIAQAAMQSGGDTMLIFDRSTGQPVCSINTRGQVMRDPDASPSPMPPTRARLRIISAAFSPD